MPVLTSAGSDSDSSQLRGHPHGGQSVFSRSSLLLVCTFMAAIAALYLLQKLVLPRFSAPRPGHYISGNSCPPRGSASWISSESKPDLASSWAQARQGQGHFEKRASWTISRGEASGTAPVGLGGPVEGSSLRSMEQEDKTTHTRAKGSREVSNDSSYGAGQESSGLPHPDLPPFPAAAEETGHVRLSSPSSLLHPPPLGGVRDESSGSAEQEKDSMDDDLVVRHWGYGGLTTTSRSTTSLFSHPYGVADDLGVAYYPDGGFNALSVVGRGPSTPQALELDHTKQPQSRSMTPTKRTTSSSRRGCQKSFENRMPIARYARSTPAELEAIAIDSPSSGYYPGQTRGYLTAGTTPNTENSGEEPDAGSSHYTLSTNSSTRRSSARTIPIPVGADGSSSIRPIDSYQVGRSPIPANPFSPSSYPPASPLLPPPPISDDYPFDPAAVMFPGSGAVDGGIRVVYADHDHEDNGHDGAADASACSGGVGGSSWTRHTRVYGGGGVCLACAAAGGGGFYGARVRPEDRRW